MNAPHPLHRSAPAQILPVEISNELSLVDLWHIVANQRWVIAATTAVALIVGGAYALFTQPVYEANLLIQVEDSPNSTKSALGEAASLFDVKTQAAAEIEILRSRMVVGQAVEQTRLYIGASPRYLPVIGSWLARRATELSDPGVLGMGGWVTGNESIDVRAFDTPEALEGIPFRVKVQKGGEYTVSSHALGSDLRGRVGVPLDFTLPQGQLHILVSNLHGKSGAEFNLIRLSKLRTIETLQDNLKLTERGRQSGVIDARLQDSDSDKLVQVLNAIGAQYIKQNTERKAAEAQKTLAFLDQQLPQLRKQLTQSEEAYNSYRNQKGTVALDEEARLLLSTSVEMQTKLLEAQQKRRELLARFTEEHPSVRTLDEQIAEWNRQVSSAAARIRTMPAVQQDALRLQRDVTVNNELYQQLRNSALQLQLVREGKVGNARLIDPAVRPEDPVRPRRSLVLMLSVLSGLLAGVTIAMFRHVFLRKLNSPQEIEARLGLSVFSTVPLSRAQRELEKRLTENAGAPLLLAESTPSDPAVESMRSLRTALQFAMLDGRNNIVLVSGATPSVGKSFVSANLAAVLAASGKRVLLVDADLRKGHINEYVGVARSPGLSDVLSGRSTFEDARNPQVLSNLDVLTTGSYPGNPAELLGSVAVKRFLEEVSSSYEIVLLDSAPILVAADTASIASHAGTFLFVARAGQTHIGELQESMRRLSHSGVTVSGAIFNAMDLTKRHASGYGYAYSAYQYK